VLRITLLLIIFSSVAVASLGPVEGQTPPPPDGWDEIKADVYFTFYLPRQLSETATGRAHMEATWGNGYCSNGVSLYVEYSRGWVAQTSEEHASQQAEYRKDTVRMGDMIGKIRSWRLGDKDCGHDRYKYTAELILYDRWARDPVGSMNFMCQQQSEVKLANQIFRTIQSP
jgi:hypothetical protein